MKLGSLSASLLASSSLFAIDASAEPLLWGSGNWGDSWQPLITVPSLSPPALCLLAAALAVSMGIALRRRPAPER